MRDGDAAPGQWPPRKRRRPRNLPAL